ncbi:hypothetical protein RB195_023918 [Necator americanus]|uniref:Uncharacterized protein n=1 Tax=Necator americanus TaxID=51031 RepID=A0ABR1ELY2_NECAM
MENRPRFFGHVMRRPSNRLVQVVLRMLPDPNWKTSIGRKRKFWIEVVKDLRTLGVDRQFTRDVKFRRLWNSDGWVDSMRSLAEVRAGWEAIEKKKKKKKKKGKKREREKG